MGYLLSFLFKQYVNLLRYDETLPFQSITLACLDHSLLGSVSLLLRFLSCSISISCWFLILVGMSAIPHNMVFLFLLHFVTYNGGIDREGEWKSHSYEQHVSPIPTYGSLGSYFSNFSNVLSFLVL